VMATPQAVVSICNDNDGSDELIVFIAGSNE